VTSVDDEVHLQHAYQRFVETVQCDSDGVRAVGHECVKRGEHQERDGKHVAHDVDEQLRLERSRQRCANVAYVQVRESCGGHGESRQKRCRNRTECIHYLDIQFVQHSENTMTYKLKYYIGTVFRCSV